MKHFPSIILLSLIVLITACPAPTSVSSGSSGNSTPPSPGLTYSGNGNTGGEVPVNATAYPNGTAVTILGNIAHYPLRKTGHTFDSWNTRYDGSGTSYSQGDSITIDGRITLYAQWTEQPGLTSRTFRAIIPTNGQYYNCESYLLASGSKCLIYVEKKSDVSSLTAQSIADEFDTEIYPTITTGFGAESDVDGNGKIILLFLDIIDGYNGTGGYYGGYFHSIHDFSTASYPNSNEADMIFLDTNPSIPGSDDSNRIIAHEYQHLINFNVTFTDDGTTQDTWVNEGLSSAAEYLYEGSVNSSRVNFYNSDPDDTIARGNNFFVWNGNWEANFAYGMLANYATVNLFFQWLRIQADNGTGIYKEILASSFRDYRAVTAAASNRIDAQFGDWPTLMSTWMIANLLNRSAGYLGYENNISTTGHYYNSANNADCYLFPGEGILSYMPISGSNVPGSSGSDIRYVGISTDGTLDKTTPYGGTYSLVYNGDSDNSHSYQTGHVANIEDADLRAAVYQSKSKTTTYALPNSYPVDIQFAPDGTIYGK